MKNGKVKDRSKEVFKSLRDLARLKAYVGVPSEKADRPSETINNAVIGYISEFGSAANNIPARPWLVAGINANLEGITEVLKNEAGKVLEGKSAEYVLERAGLTASAAVKRFIKAGGEDWEPLAESTLAARRRKGAKGDKPLYRTGGFLRSINYVVK